MLQPGWRSRGSGLGMLVLGVLLTACTAGPGGMFGRGRDRFTSNGERVYFTATSSSGDPISYEGGSSGGMMMGRLACASCHGENGRGGRVTMQQTFEAPDITWPALTAAHQGEGEMEHPPYTEETVKRAITQGVDPAEKPLESPMPRWRMSERDLDDLVAYLKTLR
jgi:cytochrome c oxidase subunit 2